MVRRYRRRKTGHKKAGKRAKSCVMKAAHRLGISLKNAWQRYRAGSICRTGK